MCICVCVCVFVLMFLFVRVCVLKTEVVRERETERACVYGDFAHAESFAKLYAHIHGSACNCAHMCGFTSVRYYIFMSLSMYYPCGNVHIYGTHVHILQTTHLNIMVGTGTAIMEAAKGQLAAIIVALQDFGCETQPCIKILCCSCPPAIWRHIYPARRASGVSMRLPFLLLSPSLATVRLITSPRDALV